MMHLAATHVRISSLAAVGFRRAAITLLLIGLASGTSLAVTRSWDGRGRLDRSWTTAENWSGDTLPGMGDVALFDRGANVRYDVDFPTLFPFGGDIKTARLLIGSNTVTFQPDGSNTGYNVAGDIQIGFQPDDVAVLNMNLSHMTANAVFIGYSYATANGTLNITNNDQLTVTGSGGSDEEFALGYDGKGTLNVSSGAKVLLTGADGDIALGLYNGTGTANVNGTGSTLTTADALWIGYTGSGILDVTAGGKVNSATGYVGRFSGRPGEATVDGIGSAWTNTGELLIEGAEGLLEIMGGGVVQTGTAKVGYCCGPDMICCGKGIVRVNGAESTLVSGAITVGGYGDGTVEITRGGRVTGSGTIGAEPGSKGKVIVDGAGSTWDTGQIIVGTRGRGSVEVTNGGRINSAVLNVAFANFGYNPIGEVRIDGQNSTLVSSTYVRIGLSYGQGMLEITNGGQLSGRDGSIGASLGMITATGAATVSGTGSRWATTNNLDIGLGLNGAGSLTIASNGTVSVGGLLKVGPTGEVHGDGNIVGNVQNNGLVSPGTSAGALNIDGNYTQIASGALLVELASPSSYDQLLVTGTATLAGTLTVNLMEGFAPNIGQTFTILTADNVNGTFTTEVLPTVPNLSFDVTYNAGSVVLSVSSALPGDFNGDGTVGAADYVAWRTNDGTLQEYNTWRSNFGVTADGAAAVARAGATAGSASANAAIPEPATLWLALAYIAVLKRLRHTQVTTLTTLMGDAHGISTKE